MAIRFDSGESFNNFFNTSLGRSQNNSANIFNNFNLSDYNSLKTGTYKRLLKSYYAKTEDDTLKNININNAVDNEFKMDKTTEKIIDNSEKVKKSLDKLAEMSYEEKNREKVTGEINSFVNSYNSVIEAVGKSSDIDLATKQKWMTNYTKSFEDELSSIGISIGSDNKLLVQKDVLEKADMKDIKAMFVSKQSFGKNMVTISAIDTYL